MDQPTYEVKKAKVTDGCLLCEKGLQLYFDDETGEIVVIMVHDEEKVRHTPEVPGQFFATLTTRLEKRQVQRLIKWLEECI